MEETDLDDMAIKMKPGTQINENKSSVLLSRDENEFIFKLLGQRCQTLATAVVQLFLTDPPDHIQWRRKDAGILCLVRDSQKRSYFFRIYCLTRKMMIWEHEVYNSLEYISPQPWFHTFEAEDSMAAFNFANEEEATTLRNILLEKLEQKKQRRMERKSRQSFGLQGSVPNLSSASTTSISHNGPVINKHQRSTSSGGQHKRRDKDPKRRLTKADISAPKDFRHVSHVGWDPNRGFDLDNVEDPTLKHFFRKAGVSETQLRDRETREFIYSFINDHGGMNAVKEDIDTVPKAPPVPVRAPPPPQPSKPSPPPPPPPSQNAMLRNQQGYSHNQGVHQRTAPPPPPPPVLKPTNESSNRNVPVPPPPPPPPIINQGPPPPPPPVVSAPPANDPRSALMEAIRGGATLKHVDVENDRKVPDSRNELLGQIRQGVELRSVQPNERSSGPSLPVDGLAGALARALLERNRAFHNDSDSDSGSDGEGDSDSEWEE